MLTLSRLLGTPPSRPARVLDEAEDCVAVVIQGDISLQLKFARSMASAWRERNQVAFIVVDVRHNRPFGGPLRPLIEEQVLQSVEQALKACMRSSDSVTRTSHQQFSILLNRVAGAEGVSRAFGRIVRSLEQDDEPELIRAEPGVPFWLRT